MTVYCAMVISGPILNRMAFGPPKSLKSATVVSLTLCLASFAASWEDRAIQDSLAEIIIWLLEDKLHVWSKQQCYWRMRLGYIYFPFFGPHSESSLQLVFSLLVAGLLLLCKCVFQVIMKHLLYQLEVFQLDFTWNQLDLLLLLNASVDRLGKS